MLKSVLMTAVATMAMATAAFAEVRVERVTFSSGGETLVGDLYVPLRPKGPLPAVVVSGAWTTVKEQMAGRYAAELAERGYAALAFDYRGFGESGGARRQFENPQLKIDDLAAAYTYLTTRADIDAERIGGLGVCGTSGYVALASVSGAPFRSVALVAPWLHDEAIARSVYTSAGFEARMASGRAAQASYEARGRQTFVPAAGSAADSAAMIDPPYYLEAGRGMIEAWDNRFDVASWDGFLSFDHVSVADSVAAPLLMVHSEAAAIPQGAHAFFARLTGPKAEVWLDDRTQFHFYDDDGTVTKAADAVAAHFDRTLR
jgi:uncharacterized protein